MRWQLNGLLLSLAAVALFTGCGTPGAPQLPSLQLARPVDDLTAFRKGYKVQLEWTLPRKNTDRTLVKSIAYVRICRHTGTSLISSCSEVAQVTPPKPRKSKTKQGQPGHLQYTDTLPTELGQRDPTGFVTYAVEVMNMHDRSAGLSNQVALPVASTLPPPEEVAATVDADGVHVSWLGPPIPPAPAGLTFAYHILRRPSGAPVFIALADVEPSANGSYLDKTFEWERKYDYRITPVTMVHAQGVNTGVEGEDSKIVEIFTRDIYPPAQPAGVQAVFSSVGQKPFIDLAWAPNLESDLAGYNVYRQTGSGPPEKLNQQLIPVPSFRDEAVRPGRYTYTVTAVDLRGNESAKSAPASETVPDKQ